MAWWIWALIAWPPLGLLVAMAFFRTAGEANERDDYYRRQAKGRGGKGMSYMTMGDEIHALRTDRASLMQELERLRAERDELLRTVDRYEYLKGNFRVMSLDMGGNHEWVGIGRTIGRGPTLEDAIDAALESAPSPGQEE